MCRVGSRRDRSPAIDTSDPAEPVEVPNFVPPAGQNPVKPPQRGVLANTAQIWGVVVDEATGLIYASDMNTGLWILRRQGAEWLAIPAVWPATQFYYVAMALPAVVKRPLLAAAFALPAPLLVPIAVVAMAASTVWRERRGRRTVAASPTRASSE